MIKNKKTYAVGVVSAFIGVAISSFCFLQRPAAVSFTPLDVVGKGLVNLGYGVDDTKRITNYSGVDKVQACVDCKETLNLTYSMLLNGKPVTNNNGQVVQRVNKGDLTSYQFRVPTSIKDGKHWLCLQTEDDTAKTLNGNFQQGNVSIAKDNVSCKRFYYDIEAPKLTDMVLNKNNKYTNSSDIPVTMKITDNYAGVRDIKYEDGNGGTKTVPAADIKCSRNKDAGANEGKWSCDVDTVIHINSDRADANVRFLLTDNVGNSDWSASKNIRFDKILPSGTLKIHEDGDGVVNSQIGYVEYHVKDTTKEPWIYPSGLVKVSVSEMDGTHEEVLLNEPDLTKDKQTSLDGMLTDYLLTTCYKGKMSLKMFVKDRAGNYSGDKLHPGENIISNEVVCSLAKVSRFDVTDVVNPKHYTESVPFTTLSWVFNDGATPEGMDGGILAPLLAGANANFEYDVEWTGDKDAVATSNYTVYIHNEAQGYERSFNGTLNGSSFVQKANGKKYSTFKEMITLPKDAPKNSKVTITSDVTITSIEGGKNKVTKSSALFDKNGHEALWGKVEGSIDDYLWFGETN